MGRVIQDMPDDPVGYIINILQGIHKKQRIVTDLNDRRTSSGARPSSKNSSQRSLQNERNGINPRSNNLAASWSAGEAQVSSKSREYPRPWTSNSKVVENRTWSPEENTKLERGEAAWNSDTRVPTHDFDELFNMEQGEEKASQKLPQEKYNGGKSWDDQDRTTREKTSVQSRDPQLSGDDLNSELKLGQYKKSKSPDQNADDVFVTRASRSRPIKARRAVEEHRQQLQALLLEGDTGKSKEPKRLQYSPEEGMEILERMEDLQEEGLATAAKKGAKLDKSKRSKTDENVSVTICARCARIIGGQADDDASSQVRSSFTPVPLDGSTRKRDDFFDNYDGASQASEILSSRERNAWPMASDSESEVTARNNVTFKQRVKSQSPVHEETKRMYRSSSSPEPSSRISTSRSNNDVPDGFLNSPRKSRAINAPSSENEADVEASRPSTPGSVNGQPWNIPSDKNSDDESTALRLGSTGFPRVERNRRSKKFTSDADVDADASSIW